jgi:hypothetical protein
MTTITIYKAPQKGKGQKLLMEGFQAADFPDYPPYLDGCCYFAGANDRSIAEEFNQSYQEGILEVAIDATIYEQSFRALEYRYDEKDDRERIEVVVPQHLFSTLNQFPRVLTALRAWITPAIFVRAALRAALTKIAVAYSSENGYKPR